MQHIFEGKISVKAALFSPYRKIEKIMLDRTKKDRDTAFILRKAKEKNIPIQLLDRNEIDAMCEGKTHGGVIAICNERSYQELETLFNDHSFIAIVEGVEDPFNFGFVLRSLYAAGVDGIIMPPRNWTSAASTLAKSSAGASESLKMVISENMEETLQILKKNDIKIVCANRDENAIEMYDYDFKQKVCICIGGEKRGLSKTILNASDQDVYIPYQNDFKNALSAASASTILAYEVLRQRR